MAILIEKTCEPADASTPVFVDRHTLYTRRWRAKAEDGTELAVALESPAADGEFLDGREKGAFLISQIKEDVIAIPLPKRTEMAAKLGWYLGNQHLPVEVRETEVILEERKTLAKSLDRIGIPYSRRHDVFRCQMHSHTH